MPRGQYALKTVLSLVTCGVSASPTCIRSAHCRCAPTSVHNACPYACLAPHMHMRVHLACACACATHAHPLAPTRTLPTHPQIYIYIYAYACACARACACLGQELKGRAAGERDVLGDDVGQVVGQPAARHSLVAARALLDPRGDEARLALLRGAAAVGGDQPEHVRVGWLEPPKTARAHRGGTLMYQPPRPAPCAVQYVRRRGRLPSGCRGDTWGCNLPSWGLQTCSHRRSRRSSPAT